MRKIKLLISYDGSNYLGWQRQPSGRTIQSELEAALSRIYNQPIQTIGSGRTDAGTHAIGQVAHFAPPKAVAEHRLLRALNALLPADIVIKGAWAAPEDFHALASASRKTYIYRIWNGPLRSALWRQRAYWVPHPVDLKVLSAFAREIVGTHDFKSFQSSGTPVKSTVRHIDLAEWRPVRPGGRLLEFRIRGTGFLKQMVRNLVGTMLHLERNAQPPSELERIFKSLDRQAAKTTAPAHGLYLYHVEYPESLNQSCIPL